MKVVILGADSVGRGLAIHLVNEGFSVTVVDEDEIKLQQLQQGLDINTIQGWPSHPEVLTRATGSDADLLIAVTQNDEINLVACDYAERLKIGKKIARVHDPYFKFRDEYIRWGFNADVLISPELEVSLTLRALIEHPEATQVYDFANGKVKLAVIRISSKSNVIQKTISETTKNFPFDIRIVALYREKEVILPEGDTYLQANDELFVIASQKDLRRVAREFNPGVIPYKRVTIVGGGKIGFNLAKQLEKYFQVKVFETDFQRCTLLASELKSTLILHANGTDLDSLKRENIANSDVFCAVSNNDETNVVSCLLAKKMGVQKTIALVNNSAYINLIDEKMINVDQYISPKDVTLSTLLAHIRKVDVSSAYSMRRGSAEALEIIVHDGPGADQLCGKEVELLPLPYGTTVGAIIRDDTIYMAHSKTVIQKDDHLIIFTIDKSSIHLIENLMRSH